jgi:hypothetical protein
MDDTLTSLQLLSVLAAALGSPAPVPATAPTANGTSPSGSLIHGPGGQAGNPTTTIQKLIADQHAAQQRYESLLQIRLAAQANRDESKKNKPSDDVEELRKAQEELKQATRRLCRSLKETPDDADNWKKVLRERQDAVALLQSAHRELFSGIMAATPNPSNPNNAFGNPQGSSRESDRSSERETGQGGRKNRHGSLLLTSPQNALLSDLAPRDVSFDTFSKKVADAVAKHDWAREVVDRERTIQRELKELRGRMEAEAAERQKAIKERAAAIDGLKRDVAALLLEARVLHEKESRERDASLENRIRVQGVSVGQLQNELEQLDVHVQMEQRAHLTLVSYFESRNTQSRELLDNWNKKYEIESGDMEQQVETRVKDREAQVQRLRECEARYERELEEQARREEEERVRKELEEQRKQEEERERAAVLIQRKWREFRERKSGGKKKGKGKGKGGDDKKKKKK